MFELLLLKKKVGIIQGHALFVGGYGGDIYSGALLNTTEEYDYPTMVLSAGVSLQTTRRGQSAAGNSQNSIMAFGYSGVAHMPTSGFLSSRVLYRHALKTFSSSTAMSVAMSQSAASSNENAAVFAGGYNPSYLSAIRKYQYSSDAEVTGTSLSAAKAFHASAGNPSFCIFAAGYVNGAGPVSVEKYQYSNDLRTSATSLSGKRWRSVGHGNSSLGIFSGGNNSVNVSTWSEKYLYANDTVSSATAITVAVQDHAAAGNGIFGIISGGASTWETSGVSYANTNKYIYSGNAVMATTSLKTPRYGHCGISEVAGWSV